VAGVTFENDNGSGPKPQGEGWVYLIGNPIIAKPEIGRESFPSVIQSKSSTSLL